MNNLQILLIPTILSIAITLFLYYREANIDMRANYNALLDQIQDAEYDSDINICGTKLLLFTIQYKGLLASWYIWHLNRCYNYKLECYTEEDFSSN